MIGIPKKKHLKVYRDHAIFNEVALRSVYGDHPRCFLTDQWQFLDPAHIFGRGYVYGSNKRDEDRYIFSSIFNCAFLSRDIHKGSQRDAPEMRILLLRLARERIYEAIRDGSYELTDWDAKFLAFADKQTRSYSIRDMGLAALQALPQL